MAQYIFSGSVTLGIWVRKAGVWTKSTQTTALIYQTYGAGGTKTVNWTVNRAIQLGTGIEAFGVTIDANNGNVSSSVLNDITHITWTAQGTPSGTRTALPNNATTTVTIRPQ